MIGFVKRVYTFRVEGVFITVRGRRRMVMRMRAYAWGVVKVWPGYLSRDHMEVESRSAWAIRTFSLAGQPLATPTTGRGESGKIAI